MSHQIDTPNVPQDGAETNTPLNQQQLSRRKLLKVMAAGTGAVAAASILPGHWTSPIIESGVLPAHAQGSPNGNDLDPLPADDTVDLVGSRRCFSLGSEFDIALTVDISGSVASQVGRVSDALRSFVASRDLAIDQISTIGFNTSHIIQELSSDASVIEAGITELNAFTGGSTAISLGIDKATEELTSSRRKSSNNPVMILFSDGLANETIVRQTTDAALNQARAAANDAKSAGIRIISVVIGSPTSVAAAFMYETASPNESDPNSKTDNFYYVENIDELIEMFSPTCTLGTTSRSQSSSTGDRVRLDDVEALEPRK